MTTTDTATLDDPRLDDREAGEVAVRLEEAEPEDVLEWGFARFPQERIALVTSLQLESLVLLDMALPLRPSLRVMTIDTGRLHPETLEYLNDIRAHFGIELEVVVPEARPVERMMTRLGPMSFRGSVEARLLCCQLRKVQPLVGYLGGLDAWITGLRRDQWATRANIRKVELDHDHDGIAKLNPLADWTSDEVQTYARERRIPIHPFYAQGFASIGCAPCTRAVAPDADPRSGRWWWETNAPKECGMHCSIETGGLEHELDAILGHQDKQ